MQARHLLVVTLTLAGLLTGCSLQQPATQPAMTHLVIAEPEQAEFRYEIELAKLNQVLMQDDLDAEQKGMAYYRRGALYDALGLRTLARMDFTRAIDYQPRLADAYNFLGIQYTELAEFDYAYEALDSAIELDPEHPYAFLNRGIAQYYDHRTKYAIDDFQHHLALDPSDPYRILWLFLAEQRTDKELARQNLLNNAAAIEPNDWALDLVNLYAGKLSEQDFLAGMTKNLRDDEKLTERLCEAYFYLGKYKQMSGQWAQAVNYFKLALTTNVYNFVEHRYAQLELQDSREQLTQP
ncbi:lipoprotein NlpI [Idiomarina seosinensis]|uniref:Lipoprotein NlpI n=1 Tax=Idiomarina seosinensis TaxID=281739 RepID=A0A432ZIV7_9GAMM|nr:lipoprotein NlpI [Idiomarina seosinensis]RUO77212.1 lipoprotein NlpI [Idiomarina seosinensis]